ncbi:MAG TPA: carboxypeptidase-like regulatory domain-containing protein [Blastocatellia bacterium]|nr:carboxypeptidase-like regulatory domain-containing protein [Blastocatellia bacterium]
MKHLFFRAAVSAISLTILSVLTFGQVSSTSPLSGSVTDPTGAVVPNATIIVKNNATGQEFRASTSNNGTYTIPALGVGVYTVTIEAQGFKKAVVTDVKIDAATPATVNVALEVGAQSETVVVQGGAEVLQTQSANVSTTITGRQITELPFTSRDALDLVLLLPGTTTPGRPRTSTVNGLPKGALNITLDGVNVQDNTLKSSDGFFTYIRPRIDAIDEVTVSTATPGAESAGEGAVQLKFVTRSGNNEYHGSVYEYHRNPVLNANYWFNNRDLAPNPRTGKAPRDRVLLNQYGFRLGGPISIPKLFSGRDRAFFFVNYEEYRLPEQTSRQRTILSPLAQSGIYQYSTASGVQQVDLLALAANNGQTSTVDATVGKLLSDIRQSTTTTGGITDLTDPNFQQFSFTNTGGQKRYFPTIRLDFNLTSKHHLENIYNYQKFDSVVDFLNGVDPAFPGFPNHGSQISNRFSNVTALRSTLTSSLVNEARFGLTGGTVLFFPEVNPGQFTNQGGYSLNMNSALGISNATVVRAPSRRNSPVWQFSDNLSWTRGAHSLNFGFSFSQINFWGSSVADGVVRSVTFGLATNDPAQVMFNAAKFNADPAKQPTAAQLNQARALYAVLTGRVTSISGTLALNEKSNQYALNGNLVQRARQRETGLFVQDSWRFRPNLTLTGGLRWEVQYPFTALNNNFTQTTYAGLFGISGEGNIFKPGTTTGSVTQFTQFKPGDKAYNTQYGNFAPSVGVAWTPNWKNRVLSSVFGESGQSVLRGGYSIAYNREGMNVLLSILGSNPGGTLTATQSVALGTLPSTGILLRNGIPPLTGLPTAPSYPITSTIGNSANGFLPNLDTGYVQSWTFGWQRELDKDTVIEARYVGNRGIKLWRQYNLNEINVVENGFFNEFKLAQANLAANNAAGGSRAGSFAYFGPGSGTSPLPIILGFFNGKPSDQAGNAALYTSSFFRNSTFINALNSTLPSVVGFANTIYSNPSLFANNGIAAGLARNFFVTNPDVGTNGSFVVDNGGRTSYDALVIELRRRLSKGLLVQGSYTFARAFTNMFASSSVVFSQYSTLRNPGLDKSRSPFGITHAFKSDWIYELPIGKGQMLLGNSGGVLDRIVGGWAFHGTARLQSGTPFDFGNVQLVNMTLNQLRDSVRIRKEPNKVVYYLPQDLIDNTRRAFGSLSGTPTGSYLAPANYNNPVAFTGQNGFSHVVLYGPRFTRFDLSAVKKTRITERVNFEFRAEFLNAFNNINFIVGNPANDVNILGVGGTTFGQVTQAYRDTSTTNDPGGRLIQFVARINF